MGIPSGGVCRVDDQVMEFDLQARLQLRRCGVSNCVAVGASCCQDHLSRGERPQLILNRLHQILVSDAGPC